MRRRSSSLRTGWPMPNFMPSPLAFEHSSPDFRIDSPHSDDMSEQQEGRRNIMKIRDTVALGITDNDGKAGTAVVVPVIDPADCKQVFVEKKMGRTLRPPRQSHRS